MNKHIQQLRQPHTLFVVITSLCVVAISAVIAMYSSAHPNSAGGEPLPFEFNPYFTGGICTHNNSACTSSDDCSVCNLALSTPTCTHNSTITCTSNADCHRSARCLPTTIPDLDNCPAGPYSKTCFDQFGIQISCANSDQVDSNFNLQGDVCDPCGNGIVDPGEQCDYGTAPFCNGPDGRCNTARACNPGGGSGATCVFCSLSCQLEVVSRCGNGTIDPGEQCDDGNRNNGDACESNCTLPARCNAVCNPLLTTGNACGNGFTCSGVAEGGYFCRDSRCADKADCNCGAICGNGSVEPGEQCDGDAGCDPATCTWVTASCNNNNVQEPGEQCDGTDGVIPGYECQNCRLVEIQCNNTDIVERDGLVVIEVESAPVIAPWVEHTDSDVSGSYYRDESAGSTYSNNPGPALSYTFNIINPGDYVIRLRSKQPGDSNCPPQNGQPTCDKENDVWMRVDGGDWVKYVNFGQEHGNWFCGGFFETCHHCFQDADPVTYINNSNGDDTYLSPVSLTAGEHTFELAPRSGRDGNGSGFAIDRIILYSTNHRFFGDNTLPYCNVALPETIASCQAPTGTNVDYQPVLLSFTHTESKCESEAVFRHTRFDVEVTMPSGIVRTVPGFFAADGNAAQSLASCGTQWHAYFTPTEAGEHTYVGKMYEFNDAALGALPPATAPTTAFPLETFTVGQTPTGRGFFAKGPLQYVGERYLRFANGEYFIKGGADSPENFLGYKGFHNTWKAESGRPGSILHSYSAHQGDWQVGNPNWPGGSDGVDGKNIIGLVNYLSGKGINSIYFLTYNVDEGDGGDTWPWVEPYNRKVFDVSKLSQWNELFTHMSMQEVMLHVVTQEDENEGDLGGLTVDRQLYYRELVARFGHHPAITWNIGEENGPSSWSGYSNPNNDQHRIEFAQYISDLDIYDHNIVVHTPPPPELDNVYEDLVGNTAYTGASLQTSDYVGDTEEWIRRSREAGRPWVVTYDEQDDQNYPPRNQNVYAYGRAVDEMWKVLFTGGAGVEWYYGYSTGSHDLNAENHREREGLWTVTKHALDFMKKIPFHTMWNDNGVTSSNNDTVLRNDDFFAIYREGGNSQINLPAGEFDVEFFDPYTGLTSSSGTITGGNNVSYGNPPGNGDWVVLIKRK